MSPHAAAIDSAWLGSFSPMGSSGSPPGGRWRVDSPPCDSHSRISEWEENSGALLADAFNVRRLLRLGLYCWRIYMTQTDQILDALYISEKEGEIRISLSVLLAWVMFCQYSRTHRELSNGLSAHCRYSRTRNHFRVWHRLAHSRRRFPLLERRLNFRTSLQAILGWKRWVATSARPHRQLRMIAGNGRLKQTWSEWKRARTSRYLDNMQAVAQMEISAIQRAFKTLRRFAYMQERTRMKSELTTQKIAKKLLVEWREKNGIESAKRLRFLSNFSAVFLAYKLAVSAEPMVDFHVGLHVRARPAIQRAVLCLTLRRWLETARRQKLEKIEEEETAKRNFFNSWRSHVGKEKRLRKCVKTLQSWVKTKGRKMRVLNHFLIWKSRFFRRNSLRSNLENFSEKSSACLLLRTLSSWRNTACSEQALARRSVKLTRARKRDLMAAWIDVHSRVVAEKIRSDIASLYRKKILGSVLLDSFNLIVRRRRWNLELDRRGRLLGLQVRFQRWHRAADHQKSIEKRRKKFQRKSLQNCFQTWWQLSRAVGLGRLANVTNELRQKQIIMTTFTLNLVVSRKDRMDQVLVSELKKRAFFQRLKRNHFHRQTIKAIGERHLELRTLRRWIHYMVVSESVSRLEKIRSKFVLNEIFHLFSEYSKTQTELEEKRSSELQMNRVRKSVEDWRLMALESRIIRFKNQRDSLSSVRELKSKVFKALRNEFSFRQKLLSVCHRRSARLARSVFDRRRSGWQLALKSSKTASKFELGKKRFFFQFWLHRIHKRLDLMVACEALAHQATRRAFIAWFAATRGRYRIRKGLFQAWRRYSNSTQKITVNFMQLAPRISRTRMESSFHAWMAKVVHRDELRTRVASFAVNNTQRLLLSALIGFSEHADEKRKIKRIDHIRASRIAVQSVDRWIHATVFKMALREVTDRLETIGENLSMFRAIEKLRLAARLKRFWEKRSLTVTSKSSQKLKLLSEGVLLGWSAAAFRQRTLREKGNKFLKKLFVKSLKSFAVERREMKTKIAIADELSVDVQARHFTDLIAELVVGWQRVAARENALRMQAAAINDHITERAAFEAMDQWKAALEFRLYDNDLRVNEEELVERIAVRTLSNVFTYLVIVFREAQGLQMFAGEYRGNRLRALAISGFVQSLVLGRKRKIIQRMVNEKLTKKYFLEIFTHVYLAIKERLVFKRFAIDRVFAKLRENVKRRRQSARADVLGRWRVHKDSERLSPHMRLLSIALAAWFAVTSQARLTKQYLPAFRLEEESMISVRNAKVYPISNSVAVTAAASPEIQAAASPPLFSYRAIRPKRPA